MRILLSFWIFLNLVSVAYALETNAIFPNEVYPAPPAISLAAWDWNEDGWVDVLILGTLLNRPDAVSPVAVAINDSRGGIATIEALGEFKDWYGLSTIKVDNAQPKIMGITNKGIHELKKNNSNGLELGHSVFEFPSMQHIEPIDINRDGVTDLLAAQAYSDLFLLKWDKDQGKLIEFSHYTTPFPNYFISVAGMVLPEGKFRLFAQVSFWLGNGSEYRTVEILNPQSASDSKEVDVTSPAVKTFWGSSGYQQNRFQSQSQMVVIQEDRVYRNTSLRWGTFDNEFFQEEGSINGPILAALLVDWDQDGVDDLLVNADYTHLSGISIIPGLQAGGFDSGWHASNDPPPLPTQSFGPRIESGNVVVGDINEDGYADRIYSTFRGMIPGGGDTTIFFQYGNSDGTYTDAYNFPGCFVDSLALYDFNHDGHLDLLRRPLESGTAFFHQGLGNGYFVQSATMTISGISSGAIGLGDFNGDGLVDLVNGNGGSDYGVAPCVYIALGNYDGTFQPYRTFGIFTQNEYDGWFYPTIIPADVNGDGFDDLWFKDLQGYWLNRSQGTSHNKNWTLYP